VKLARLGARPVPGDIADSAVLGEGMRGAEAVFHIAGAYRIGVKESEHEAMFLTNVDGTTLVLDAAITAGAERVVYVSTVGVFGNTHGKVVDETYDRPDRDFLSYYDATKFMAHRVAKARAAAGAPLVIVQPGAIYGPGDHSELGAQITQVTRGKYRLRMFPELGITMSYVADVADGLLLAADKGRPGEAYVIAGEVARLGNVLDKVAGLSGRRRARWKVPTGVIRAAAPLGPVVGVLTGSGGNLRETIRASSDVTYWASSDKAKSELGYAPRSLEQGLRDLLAAR
jgi:nucleoside-diphosphate-sugar epimerase